ncbi:Protein of unknown function [Cotesia congregata]|uniref:Uncharacterized protein n=1 Tax=Cotesia congregata TaxID=51543 RepID=A0A8J2E6G5_COTCN|nr:Protein of unknown function [Cotesia congregata]
MLIQNFVIGKILLPPHDDDDNDVTLFNNMMRYLFNNCRKEFGTIGIWGNQPSFLKDGEMDVVLSNDSWRYKIPFPNIKSFVIFIDDLFHSIPFIETREEGNRRKLIILFVFDRSGYYLKNNLTGLFPIIGGEDYTMQNTVFYYCYVTNEGKIEILTANSHADFAPANWDTDNFGVIPEESVNRLITKNTPTNEIVKLLDEECGNYSLWLMESLNISLNITIKFSRSLRDENIVIMNQFDLLEHHLILQPLPQSAFNGDFDDVCISYPIQYFHDVIVTSNRGLMSPLEKMFEFYGWVTIIATIIILSVTFLVIYQSNNHRISFALLECLRLIIGYNLNTRINNDNMRVFFSVIFLYFLIIQATFSGHLATFLTKPVHRRNVETLDDLKDPHYQYIFLPRRLYDSDFIEDKLLIDKFIGMTFLRTDSLIGDNRVALIMKKN